MRFPETECGQRLRSPSRSRSFRGWEESRVGRKAVGAAGEVGKNQEQVVGEPSGKLLQGRAVSSVTALRKSAGRSEKGLLGLVTWRFCASFMTCSGVFSVTWYGEKPVLDWSSQLLQRVLPQKNREMAKGGCEAMESFFFAVLCFRWERV